VSGDWVEVVSTPEPPPTIEDTNQRVIERTAPFDFTVQPNIVECNLISITGTGQAKADSNFIN